MSNTRRKAFSGRGFTSVALSLAFLGLVASGVVLCITPPGRVAYWTDWHLVGLGKDDWSNLHLWFALLVAILSGFHIWLNWRPLLSYFKSLATRRFALRGDWLLATLLCIVVAAGTIAQVPPFPALIAWSDSLKASWGKGVQRGPVSHAELLSLRDLASEAGADLEVLIERLAGAGIRVESADVIVLDLARANDTSPARLYEIAVGGGP